ncbi:MAG: hypothetical protein V7604_2017 [Hyphomicrobiales bacterium]
MLLRLVAALTALIVLIVVALLVHATPAHVKFALAFGARRDVRGLGIARRLSRVRHVVFLLQNTKLLFVRPLSLHLEFLHSA